MGLSYLGGLGIGVEVTQLLTRCTKETLPNQKQNGCSLDSPVLQETTLYYSGSPQEEQEQRDDDL